MPSATTGGWICCGVDWPRSTARFAPAAVTGLTDRLDLLVNNAGGMVKEQIITSEGHEHCFASNHAGPLCADADPAAAAACSPRHYRMAVFEF